MHASARYPASADTALAARLLWVPPVVLAAWCFYPITQNYFFGDDLYNLYEIVNRGVIEYLVKPYGMHLLAARNLVYYLCYRIFGTNAEPYFWIVLSTHLLNVFLLFQVLQRLTGPWLACVGATWWGVAPIDEGALGWFSVYGQVLATTMILWVLDRLVRIADGAPLAPGAPLRWAALLIVASTSFGTGIGAALTFPFVALVLLPRSPARRRILIAFGGVALVLPVLYVASHWLADFYHAPNTGGMGDAVGGLTSWSDVLWLTGQLTAFGLTSLVLGPFLHPVPYPSRTCDVVAVVALVAALVALALGGARRRRELLAVLGLGLACYGIIAVGRVAFFLALGTHLIASPRYHYAATFPFCIALFVMLAMLERGRWAALAPEWRVGVLAAALAAPVIRYAIGGDTIDHHPRERAMAVNAVAEIRGRIDAAPPGADVYMNNQRFSGVGPLMIQRPDLFPGFTAIFAIYFPNPVVDGKRVFFVIWDQETLEAARQGRKTATFVVGPGQRPGAKPAAIGPRRGDATP